MALLSQRNLLHLVLAMCLLPGIVGCGNPPSHSEESNDIVLALYTTCRLRNKAKLDGLLVTTETALKESKITEKEALIIQGIISMAGDEQKWAEAAQLSREFLDSQVKGR